MRLTCLTPGFPHESPIRQRPRRVWPFLLLVAALLFASGMGFGAESSGIQNVSISRPFFNPSLGQKIGIFFSVDRPGSLTVLILDRDGFLVRRLVAEKSVEKGPLSFDWDGRDDRGEIVPDEAYSLKIDLSAAGRTETYFPGDASGERLTAKTNYYDRRGGILSYTLPRPSRVRIHAGSEHFVQESLRAVGPVLKTVVNAEPRVAGSIVETWNGFDESGSIYVAGLGGFFIKIVASALPENSVITIGNRSVSFWEGLAHRAGKSFFMPPAPEGSEDVAISGADSVAPVLRLQPRGADWSARERVWRSQANTLRLSVSLEGPTATSFARKSHNVVVFAGEDEVLRTLASSPKIEVDVPLKGVPDAPQTLTVNWVSGTGTVAANSVRLEAAARHRSKGRSKP